MKKILIITYYWPPSGGSGVQRWLKMAKYLPEFGWQPIIYTPSNPDFTNIDSSLLNDITKDMIVWKRPIWEPYQLARLFSRKKNINTGLVTKVKKQSLKSRLMNWVRGNWFIPDPRKFWVKPSVNWLSSKIASEGIEQIITTGPPHSMHLIGLGLKKANPNIRWIADFRDPWSKLDFLDTFNISSKNRQKYIRMEKSVLDACDVVLGTSPSMPTMLVDFDISKFTCITNGYDSEDFNTTAQEAESIVIYHAGLLNQVRFCKHFFAALSNLVKEGKRLTLHLVGNIDPAILSYLQADRYLSKVLKVEPYKSHEEILEDYQKASHLLLLVNNTDNSQVNIPGKLFEYMAAGKYIIGIGNDDDDAIKILKEENMLTYSYDKTIDPDTLWEALKQRSAPAMKQRYSRKSLTKKLVNTVLEKQ